uniref:RNA helicase n=1 Tax=Arcella intermedia TaxID=1963864 RepID=A0A6B2KYI9_9EUKA
MGYRLPTPIQRKTIPLILEGKDVVAMARTGSGKSAAFIIPMLNKLKTHSTSVGARGLILSPTRELAFQTLTFCQKLGKMTDLRVCLIVGGDAIEQQFERLSANPDIIVATPGRLKHMLDEVEKFSLKSVEYLVFDEGDRLFEMGFQEDLNYILNKCSPSRQTLIFSATLPAMLASFVRAGLNQPSIVRLDTEAKLSENLQLEFFSTPSKEKDACLLYLLKEYIDQGKQTIVFTATRHHVEYLCALLTALYPEPKGVCIYGKMDQSARKINLAKFTHKKAHVMFVTDLAARGIDIPLLDVVINYDFPTKPKLFVHRVGRVARAGRSGVAYSLVSKSELPYVLDLMLFLGRKLYTPEEENIEEKALTIGSFPRPILETTFEAISLNMASNLELQALHKSTVNAYKLYNNTKTAASVSSVRRAHEISNIAHHKLLRDLIDEAEYKRQDYLSQIKSFRPSQTIFEQQEAPEQTNLIMQAKRRSHTLAIIKEKERILLAEQLKKREKERKDKEDKEIKEIKKSIKDTGTKEDEKDEDESDSEDNLPETDEYKEENSDSDKDEFDETNQDEIKGDTLLTDVSTSNGFKDDKFFMSMTPKNAYSEKGLEIEKNQSNFEDLVLDLIDDDSKSIFRQKTVTVWDKRKNNYVKQKADNLTNKGKVKDTNKKKAEPGKLYKEWSTKNKKEVGRVGEVESQSSLSIYHSDRDKSKFRHHKVKVVKTKEELRSEQQIRKTARKKQKQADRLKSVNNKKRKAPLLDRGFGPKSKKRKF